MSHNFPSFSSTVALSITHLQNVLQLVAYLDGLLIHRSRAVDRYFILMCFIIAKMAMEPTSRSFPDSFSDFHIISRCHLIIFILLYYINDDSFTFSFQAQNIFVLHFFKSFRSRISPCCVCVSSVTLIKIWNFQ